MGYVEDLLDNAGAGFGCEMRFKPCRDALLYGKAYIEVKPVRPVDYEDDLFEIEDDYRWADAR